MSMCSFTNKISEVKRQCHKKASRKLTEQERA
jgi:hypothetical protein